MDPEKYAAQISKHKESIAKLEGSFSDNRGPSSSS
jgi:hypothetical protein